MHALSRFPLIAFQLRPYARGFPCLMGLSPFVLFLSTFFVPALPPSQRPRGSVFFGLWLIIRGHKVGPCIWYISNISLFTLATEEVPPMT
ncbi:hypothetical protein L210DRAFT_3563340 [Boletus edulis BED1]|uniref:Uncharacterized protein n=1 Tax=Boletus edulis BED1 TaxID=1328754 RepID=A0AAD4BHH2_BOLED|nr:hypothetical protein L210DRAFT_3563340 [Boletus edulis BED1]